MTSPKIAACLIVKDSEAVLEAALASIRPFVDGVFIYDTGSTDGTLALLEQLNAKRSLIISEGQEPQESPLPADHAVAEGQQRVPLAEIHVTKGEWREDFSWARQQNWDMVPDEYEWAVWLDDDDVIEGAHNLRMLAANAQPELHGYIVEYDYARDEQGACVCVLWRERLMRRAANYHWEQPVHECLVPPEGQTPVLMMLPPQVLRYVHNRPAERYKPSRNLGILEKLAAEQASEHGQPLPRTLAYLGTEHMARGAFDLAAQHLAAYTEHPESLWSDERSQVRHKLAVCLRILGQAEAAVECEFQALKERDDWTENLVGLSSAFAELGQWGRAEEWARRALEKGMPQSPLILNPLEHSLVPRMILTDAYLNLGRFDEARVAARAAQAVAPENPGLQQKVAEVDRAAHEAEIVGAVLMLREVLVRHDENLKAYTLMQSVPYVIHDSPAIVHARAAQRQNVMHVLRPEEYRRWYEDEPKESTVPDEFVENVGEHIERAAFTLEDLREQEAELGRKPKVLDMGGNDMWLACYLWKQGGYHVDGVELNKHSVTKGRKRMRRFGAPGSLVQGDLHEAHTLLNGSGPYDAVLMYEVLEHVPDPQAALAACEGMLAADGRVYLTTPNGAFERGMIERWSVVEPKGHVRALPAQELAAMLMDRGHVEDFRIHAGDGRLTFAAYKPRPPRSHVTLYAGGSWEPWSPESLRKGGIGGSETCLVQVATRLAVRGHRVTVYSGADEGIYGGVLYRPFTAWDPTEEPDLLIVSRLPHVLDNPLGAKRTVLWCHDHSYPNFTEAHAEKLHRVVCLSDWERERFLRLYPWLDEDKLEVIRNGIGYREIDGTARYPEHSPGFDERECRAVFSSSADRGLDVLLELWPKIRKRVPEAQLHVYYGFDTLERVAQTTCNANLMTYRAAILSRVEELGGEEGGVFLRGRVGQDKLRTEMLKARVWSYPTAFLETSCIGAMEARAAGLAIVTSDLAGLKESVGEHGVRLPWGKDEDKPRNRSVAYQRAFIEQVVRALSDPERWGELHEQALDGADENDWQQRIDDWERLLPRRQHARKRKREAARA